MPAIGGVYDGEVVRPLEPVNAPPNVNVVVVFVEEGAGQVPDRDIMQYFGRLKDSPAFQGDSVELQRKWRDEWE
ncbi:MAG: hypothetical protein HY706_06365 [Candidatus Hydrogenedentes bacterium]|nr:hypothetical protein [Candidatus Hydrogenedentota bacterium]